MPQAKPLVIIGGIRQRLPAGYTLDAPQSGGDQMLQTNDEVGAIVICTPVYNDVADGVKKAQANAAGTKDLIGLVAVAPSIAAATLGPIQTNGVLQATTAQWDAVTGGSGGLTVRTRYYLDAATAGKLTAIAPDTTGQWLVEVGIANSPTELDIQIQAVWLL